MIGQMRQAASVTDQRNSTPSAASGVGCRERSGEGKPHAYRHRAHDELKNFVNEAQTRLTSAFTELAGRVFDEKAQVFERNVQAAGAQSKADIDLLLKPLGERLADFRQRVDALYGEEAKERAALLGAVSELKTLNQDMAAKTESLTRALKGNAKFRGDWGETTMRERTS